jgi:predicted RNA binding protein YcfA (HicA-like mRNA interferase family)
VTRRTFSGREIVKALQKNGFTVTGGGGSHRKLAYVHPETGEKRVVTVPLHNELATGTLNSIKEQCGGKDLDAFCEWIEANS